MIVCIRKLMNFYMIVESKSIRNRALFLFMVILSLLIIQNACCAFGAKKRKKWKNILSQILAQGQLSECQNRT